MTNGGGASEEDRCKRLSEQLGFEVGPSEDITASALMLHQDHHLHLYAITHRFEVLGA
jgi:hypothetical protein